MVTIQFRYPIGYQGDRKVDPLESQSEKLEYQIKATGCDQPELTTIVSAPLFDIPPEERTLTLLADDKQPGAVTKEGWRRLLMVEGKKQLAPLTELLVGEYTETAPRPTDRDRLLAKWRRQAAEIGSAQIEFRRFFTGEVSLKPLSPGEVKYLLEQARLEEQPETADKLVAKLLKGEELAQLPTCRYQGIGLKSREECFGDLRIVDGEVDIRYDRNNAQINVYRDGDSRRARLGPATIRIAPPNSQGLAALARQEAARRQAAARTRTRACSNRDPGRSQDRLYPSRGARATIATPFSDATGVSVWADRLSRRNRAAADSPQPDLSRQQARRGRTRHHRQGRVESRCVRRHVCVRNSPNTQILLYGSEPASQPKRIPNPGNIKDLAEYLKANGHLASE